MKKIITFGKKAIILTIGILTVFAFSTEVLAQSSRATTRQQVRDERASAAAAVKDRALETLKTRATTMTDNRISALNRLITRIDGDKRISDTDKASLKNDINGEISKLNDLKTKISQETTAEAVRADFKQVLGEKIYAFYIQKMQLLIMTENLLATETTIENVAKRVQGLLTKLSSEGKDVKTLQTYLDDINAKLTDSKTLLEGDKTKLLASTPADKTSFPQVRKDYATVRLNFAKIRADIARMRVEFRTIKAIKTTGTPASSSAKTTE